MSCEFCNKVVGHWSDCPTLRPGFSYLEQENKRLRELVKDYGDQITGLQLRQGRLRELLRWAICWAEAMEEEHPSENGEVFQEHLAECCSALEGK